MLPDSGFLEHNRISRKRIEVGMVMDCLSGFLQRATWQHWVKGQLENYDW